jgi:hypothetical protein
MAQGPGDEDCDASRDEAGDRRFGSPACRRHASHVRVEASPRGSLFPMDRRVQIEVRALDCAASFDDISIGRAENKARCCYLRSEVTLRIDEEDILAVGNHETKMIAGSCLIARARRPAQHGG